MKKREKSEWLRSYPQNNWLRFESGLERLVSARPEVKRLRAENAALRKACEAALQWMSGEYSPDTMTAGAILHQLRAALEVKTNG